MTSHERNKRRMARLPASVRALVREGMLSADRAVRLVGAPEPPTQSFYALDALRGKTLSCPIWVAERDEQ